MSAPYVTMIETLGASSGSPDLELLECLGMFVFQRTGYQHLSQLSYTIQPQIMINNDLMHVKWIALKDNFSQSLLTTV